MKKKPYIGQTVYIADYDHFQIYVHTVEFLGEETFLHELYELAENGGEYDFTSYNQDRFTDLNKAKNIMKCCYIDAFHYEYDGKEISPNDLKFKKEADEFGYFYTLVDKKGDE